MAEKVKELNPNHKLFIKEYLVDRNATQAYKRVYKCSDKVANKNANVLMVNTGIKAAIAKELAKLESKIEWNIEYFRKELADAIKDAKLDDEHSVVMRGIELFGKHIGAFTEKHEHTFPDLNEVRSLLSHTTNSVHE